MEEVFKNAYLGKQYRTRDGRKAILISYNQRNPMKPYVCAVACYLDDSIKSNCYNFNEFGRRRTDLISDSDIVSEWQEVNEDELRNETEEYAENMMVIHCKEHYIECPNHIIKDALRRAYEAGYRKAIENLSK